jgi:hypothetical protein
LFVPLLGMLLLLAVGASAKTIRFRCQITRGRTTPSVCERHLAVVKLSEQN